MPTKFNMTKDVAGYNGFGVVPSQDSYGCLLAMGTAQGIVVPSQYPNYIAVFSFTPGTNVWVNFSTTATVPGGTMGANLNELNPSARQVAGGSSISLITPDVSGSYVNILLYVVLPFGN